MAVLTFSIILTNISLSLIPFGEHNINISI